MKKSLLAALILVLAAAALWDSQRPQQLATGPAPVAPVEGAATGAAAKPAAPEVLPVSLAKRALAEPVPSQRDVQAFTSLVVTVLGPDGKPVAGGSVLAIRQGGDGARNLHRVEALSASGVARFDGVFPGRYQVQEATGMARQRVDLRKGVENALTLRQVSDPLFVVHGQVVDPDGHAVPGATIWARGRGPFLPIARAGADGSYVASVGKAITLQAGLPSRLPSGSVEVTDLDGDGLAGRTCTLTLGGKAARLTGRVVDSEGAPVVGALVFAGSLEREGWQGDMFSSPLPVASRTGEGGRFEYGHSLPSGRWRLGAIAPGGHGVVRWLEVAGGDMEVLLTVQPGATIEGTVLAIDGSPAAGGFVSVRPIRSGDFADDLTGILGTEHHSPIDASGAYRLTGVLGLELDLYARTAHGQPLAQVRVQMPPLGPGETHRIDLQLSDRPVLAGVVVDEDGAPMPNIVIDASDQRGLVYHEFVKTDAAGRFRLTSVPVPLDAPGRWRIEAVSLPNGSRQVLGVVTDVAVGTEDITIVANRPTIADAFLSGRVTFPGDELPANVNVVVWRVYTPVRKRNSGASVEVDPRTGAFRAGPLAAGKYRITATRTDESLAAVEDIVVGAGETVVVPDLALLGGR